MVSSRYRVLCTMTAAVLAIAFSAVGPMSYRLLYNPSDSAPRGWYGVIAADHLEVNDWVVVHLPEDAATLAAQRRYLPRNVPLLKRIGAMAGQRVCITRGIVLIDDQVVAYIRARDGVGRMLTPWSRCRPLNVDELFLLSNISDASFDSRYFGPMRLSMVIGRAIPLWTW